VTGRRRVELTSPRNSRLALWLAMALGAALMLWAGRDTTLFSDDVAYYARLTSAAGGPPQPFGLEYLLAPYAGHLVIAGKLVYELNFAVFGTAYLPLRVLEAALYLSCIALFFALAAPRAGELPALLASVVLLFMGAAWEVMLWPFDLHTLLALAAGLGALLALERGGPRADRICCALLLVAVASIEVGLAFVAGAAVSILLRDDRRSRLWIAAIPAFLYIVWAVWASRYGQSDTDPTHLATLGPSVASSLAATVASLTGTMSTSDATSAFVVDPGLISLVLAVVVAIAFGRRVSRNDVPATSWAFGAALAVYMLSIALADRRPDSSRYVLVEAVLVLLLAADLTSGVRLRGVRLAVVAVVAALAIPLNVAKLFDGRAALVEQAEATRADYAMLELARSHVDPAFRIGDGPSATPAAAAPVLGLAAGTYFTAAERVGSLAGSLNEVRDSPETARAGADTTLAGALGLELRAIDRVADAGCETLAGAAGAPASAELPVGGAVIEAGGQPASLGVSRFSRSAPGVSVGELGRGLAADLVIPSDAAPDRWRVWANAPVRVCPRGAEAGG
jgi:hypothetical protein